MTVDEYLDLVRRSKLVDEDKLHSLLKTFLKRHAHSDSDGRAIAELLVQAKLLTEWQAEKLLAGEAEGLLLGRYKLLSVLGRGGMGIVYLAEHVRMRRRAALKILPADFIEDPKKLELFYRESEATAALDHPNIVRAYDVDNEGETYYLVMEYVDGANLHEIVSRDGPLRLALAVEYLRQAADGLAHAHDRGIIHRDVKPANIMLDVNGCIKVLDMGLSHWEEIEASGAESTDTLSGTPQFLAPELTQGSVRVDASSDIYSLGCTFYFLLTGNPPFAAKTIPKMLAKHQKEPPPSLRDHDADIPLELDQAYLRMMAKRPADRMSSGGELLEFLNEWLSKSEMSAAAKANPRQQQIAAERHKVLVAEDDEVTLQMLNQQLRKAGFEVHTASDGQQAMDTLDADTDVCLFDLNMPRATGMECLRYVNSHFPETPVIILTASGEIQDAIVAMREGAFDYLTKPCRITNVLNRIEEAIRARQRSAADGASLNSLLDSDDSITRAAMETIVMDNKGKDESPDDS